jgi:ubiquinone/menaquinone biosynthesis methyltransferase
MKPGKPVIALFDRIAPVYDRLNHTISWGLDQRWRKEIARWLDLAPGQTVLDIAAGTGDMERALKSVCPQIRVIGLDPAPRMLERYREKFPRSEVARATAETLPLKDNSISRAVCSFGVRNFASRRQGLGEIHRILTPGGLWGFLEMAAPGGTVFPIVYALYFKRIMPLLGALQSPSPNAYRYLRDSVYAFPGAEKMIEEHREIGFQPVRFTPILRGAVCLYVFKKE